MTYRIFKDGDLFGFTITCHISGKETSRVGFFDRASAMFAVNQFTEFDF